MSLLTESDFFDEHESSAIKGAFIGVRLDGYTSMNMMEQASDLVVIGRKGNEVEAKVVYDEQGSFQAAYTISEVQIEHIVKQKGIRT